MKTLPLLLAVSLSLVATARSADKALTEEQRIVHVLNRLGFGPRPGDIERVKTQGLSAYIQQQLHPETLPDTTVEAKAATFDGLAIPPRTLDRLEAQSRQKGKALRKQLQRKATEVGQDVSKKAVRQQLTEKQRQELEQAAQAKKRVAEATQQVVANKFLRAIESEKQLQEVLVDFWSNHFNIDASKVRTAKIADEQQVIRPHVLGKFSELLNASAHSAAMMLYLDNDQSTAATPAKGKAKTKKKSGGLNENYAREVMELHTLGVDGGYTQKDVTELARCLTGWGVEKGKYSSVFAYHDNLHDKKPKEVLGLRLPAGGGQEDGQAVLDLLARHPSTMRHISTQLCQRFVADNPPASLVEKCIATWKRTDGDIREILATIFTSPEFNSTSAFKSKVKSPFEYVVSAARALGASYEVGAKLQESFDKKTPTGKETLTSGQVALLGQPLFRYAFPTGYPEESSKWVSSGALIGRINFALRLTEGKLDDLKVPSLAPLSPEKPQTLALRLLGQPLSPATAATLQKQGATGTKAVALLLGSPEFQRR